MDQFKVLFLGDLVGKPGLRALYSGLSSLRERTGAHLVAVNGENLAGGYGLTPADAQSLFSLGAAVVTGGNHVWQKEELFPLLESEPRLLRPLNYPSTAPGHGTVCVEAAGVKVGFINLLGQIRMGMTVDCPFKTCRKAVEDLRKQTKTIIVDFHAEDVREKEAMAHYLNGRVSAVLGTHTHVPTSDGRILSGGTAAITDIGMCGPVHSVIGTDPEISVRRALTQLPLRLEVLDAAADLNGVLLTIDPETGRTTEMTPIRGGK